MTLHHLDFLAPADLPVPQDRPFGASEALALVGGWRPLRALLVRGLLTQPLRGVYAVPTLADSLGFRLEAVRLVSPHDAVVCDRTAAWLHGAPLVLAPGSHLDVPSPSLYLPRGRRLRNGLTESGSRTLSARDTVELGGLRVTSPLRTACDLGRLLHRDQAIAALDSMLRTEKVTRDELTATVERFRGQRGVRRLRELAPLADGRAQSPGESVLRLRWHDCGDLPQPDLQVEVPTPWGSAYHLDLGVPEIRYAGEYDGAEWHGADREDADRTRREWLACEAHWTVDAFVADNVYGRLQDSHERLRAGVRRALVARRTTWYCV